MSEDPIAPARRTVSAADVAREAGVSMQTVSRVVRDAENVLPHTRARVRLAMDTLGYRPNRAARALRSGRFHTIGVVMFTLSSYGNMKTLEALAEAASAADFTISLLPVHQRTQGDVTGAFARLSEQAVDGIVLVMDADIGEDAKLIVPSDVPVVVVDASGTDEGPVVDTDQALGARLATQHLLDLGHRTVWHVTGPERSFSARRRLASWQATLEAAGVEVPPVFPGDWTTESGYAAGLEIARRPDITAVFVGNDQMALGLLKACHELGRDVPADLSIVGFDDMTESDSFWPPLTTVHQEFGIVGTRAMETLLREIAGEPVASLGPVPVALVKRASTAPPPSR